MFPGSLRSDIGAKATWSPTDRKQPKGNVPGCTA